MMNLSKLTWTANKLAKLANNNTVTFENAVQRGYVWDLERKSLLIHSMLTGFPIPQFFASSKEGKYDMLDGKQRTSAIAQFFKGEYALKIEKEENKIVEYQSIEGEVEAYDINGKHYDELPEELKEELNAYAFDIYYYENITDDEIAELFFRLNNGKPLTQSELTRVKCPCIDKIITLGQHKLFQEALTAKGIANKTGEVISMQVYAMITEEEPCLDNKVLRPVMEKAKIDDELMEEMNDIYDFIMDVHTRLANNKKVAKRIYTKTHMVSIVPFIQKAILDDIEYDKVKEFFEYFYGDKKNTSISRAYNMACKSGAGHATSVKTRQDELSKAWKKFFDNYESIMKDKKEMEEIEAKAKLQKEIEKKAKKDTKAKATKKKTTTKKKTEDMTTEEAMEVINNAPQIKVEEPSIKESEAEKEVKESVNIVSDILAMSDEDMAALDEYNDYDDAACF